MGIQRSTLFGILAAATLAVSWSGCGKDTFTTKPQIKFIKAEDYTVSQGGLIKFYLEVTDKEGDLQDSIYIQGIAKSCPQSNFTYGYPVPEFPSEANAKVDIEVTFINGVLGAPYPPLSPQCGRADTTNFRFWIKDKAKNVSDTVQSDQPLIILK